MDATQKICHCEQVRKDLPEWPDPRCYHCYELYELDGFDSNEPCSYCVEPELITTQEHILYRVFDSNFRLLYAGITLNMYQRFNGHKHTADWWTHAKHITIERFESRAELMAAERRVIVTERPKYNKQHNGGSQ